MKAPRTRGGNQVQKDFQPVEGGPEIVASGAALSVGVAAVAAYEVIAAETAVALQVPVSQFDSGALSQLAFDGAEDTALSSGDEDPEPLGLHCGTDRDARQIAVRLFGQAACQ